MSLPPITVRTATPVDGPAMGRVHVRAWQIGYAAAIPPTFLDRLDPEQRGRAWTQVLGDPTAGERHLLAEVAGDDGVPVVAGIGTTGHYRVLDGEEAPADGSLCELHMLNVDPDHWGTGVAQALMAELVAGLRRDHDEPTAALWVLERNPRGRRFYEKEGWAADGAVRHAAFGDVELAELRYVLEL